MLYKVTNEGYSEDISEVRILVASVHSILQKDLNMHHLCQHFVAAKRAPEHRGTCMFLAGNLTTMADQNGDF
jgi:hypothetical protein